MSRHQLNLTPWNLTRAHVAALDALAEHGTMEAAAAVLGRSEGHTRNLIYHAVGKMRYYTGVERMPRARCLTLWREYRQNVRLHLL